MSEEEKVLSRQLKFVNKVCSKPEMYVGGVSMEKIGIFLEGYDRGSGELALYEFGLWLSKHYKTQSNIPWYSGVKILYPDDIEALKQCPMLYEGFLESRFAHDYDELYLETTGSLPSEITDAMRIVKNSIALFHQAYENEDIDQVIELFTKESITRNEMQEYRKNLGPIIQIGSLSTKARRSSKDVITLDVTVEIEFEEGKRIEKFQGQYSAGDVTLRSYEVTSR